MKNKKIFYSLVMLLITAIALTTASYAWFSANTNVELGQLDVSVTASDGIQISMDAEVWKAVLATEDIKVAEAYVGAKNQFPTHLTPVSTVGTNETIGKFDMYKGTVTGVDFDKLTTVKSPEANGTTGDYIAFDVFIKSGSAVDLTLNTNSIVKGKDDNSKGLEYSARVGFLKQGTDSSFTASAARTLNEGTVGVIWEPNADQHTTIAINQLGAVQGKPLAYKGVKADGEELDLTTQVTDYFSSVSTIKSTTAEKFPTDTILSIEEGITKVRIYIWIEGQDIDCEDTVSQGSGLSTVIGFSKKTT